MLWETTLGAGGYAGKELWRGARLQLQDLQGDGCVSMLVFNAEHPVERLNVADTIKVQWNAYLGAGQAAALGHGPRADERHRGRRPHPRHLLRCLERASNAERYGDGDNWGAHPNARDRFALAVSKFGLGRKDIHPCINWFKGIRVAADGTTELLAGPFAQRRRLTLRAEMNVFVVLANCPHRLDPRSRLHGDAGPRQRLARANSRPRMIRSAMRPRRACGPF